MSRDVDKAKANVAKLEFGKAQVDRDAALLFFRKSIGICAGQCPDKRGLAVVDVPSSADNDIHRLKRSNNFKGSKTLRTERRTVIEDVANSRQIHLRRGPPTGCQVRRR